MIKIFMTGDNHIGKKYDRYPDIREKLIRSRFECLEDMVRRAEEEHCDFFVVTGDLFDNISSIRQRDVRETADILNRFDGRVLILPGNHDYFTGEEKVWKEFRTAGYGEHVFLLTENEPMLFDVGEEQLCVYPAPCRSKHAMANNLGWIREQTMRDDVYNIGIAHGAIEGLTPDMNGEYFLMTERELQEIPVDAWLIGHTHIPYPQLSEEKDTSGYKIFNAGTHEQTDLHNNTEGYGFVLTLEKKEGRKTVSAHRCRSGRIRFYDLQCRVSPGQPLREAIGEAVSGIQKEAVLRLTLSGAVGAEEYENRKGICKELLHDFLTYETDDTELSEQISPEKIKAEFVEFGFAARLLEELLEDQKEAQMAYDLLKKHQA